MIIVTREIIIAKLNAFCDKHASYGAAAKALGITPAQLSTARNDAKRPLPARLLSRLGYSRTYVYIEKPPKKKAVKALTVTAKSRAKMKRKLRQLIVNPAVTIQKKAGAKSATKVPSLKESYSPPSGHDTDTENVGDEAPKTAQASTTVVDFSGN